MNISAYGQAGQYFQLFVCGSREERLPVAIIAAAVTLTVLVIAGGFHCFALDSVM